MIRRGLSCAAAWLLAVAASAWAQTTAWEPAIQAFEREDAKAAPARGGILFVGSSSIRFWNTDEDFADLDVINRGFGGSQTSDVVKYMDRIVIPYAPRTIVFYAGDNDIASGRSTEEVVADTKVFVERVHAALPETRVLYIAIKPSIARWNLVEPMRAVNAAIRELALADSLLEYVDIFTPMLNAEGKPRPELFIADGLHLSREGYDLWRDLVRPLLDESAE